MPLLYSIYDMCVCVCVYTCVCASVHMYARHVCNGYFPMYFHLAAANKSRVDFIENFFGYFATFLLSHSIFIWFLSIILKHFKKFCTAPNTNHVDKYWFTHMNPQGERAPRAGSDKFDDIQKERVGERESGRQGQVQRQVEGPWVRWITFAGHSVGCGWWWSALVLARVLCSDVRTLSKRQIAEKHVIFMVSYIYIVTLSGPSCALPCRAA